jgi:hypothetical protein
MQDRLKIRRKKPSLPVFEMKEGVTSATNKDISNATAPNGQKDPINPYLMLLKHAPPTLLLQQKKLKKKKAPR